MLRYIVTINTNNALGNQQTSEWQLSSNTYSNHLASTLESLMKDVKESVRVVAVVRHKAALGKPLETKRDPEKKKEPGKFWLKIQSFI